MDGVCTKTSPSPDAGPVDAGAVDSGIALGVVGNVNGTAFNALNWQFGAVGKTSYFVELVGLSVPAMCSAGVWADFTQPLTGFSVQVSAVVGTYEAADKVWAFSTQPTCDRAAQGWRATAGTVEVTRVAFGADGPTELEAIVNATFPGAGLVTGRFVARGCPAWRDSTTGQTTQNLYWAGCLR